MQLNSSVPIPTITQCQKSREINFISIINPCPKDNFSRILLSFDKHIEMKNRHADFPVI